jgi:leucyl aminopeptidase (aminopeptidase T)
MIVEIVLKNQPKLELEGYEKIEIPRGVVFANPVEKRVEIIVKTHPDGRVSVFTDKSDVIKLVVQSGEVVDIHAK